MIGSNWFCVFNAVMTSAVVYVLPYLVWSPGSGGQEPYATATLAELWRHAHDERVHARPIRHISS